MAQARNGEQGVRLLICGSRGFDDAGLMSTKLSAIVSAVKEPITVLSGCARGADQLGELWAADRGYPIDMYPVDWDRSRHAAGLRCNQEMIDSATHVVAFWDGLSRGTERVINLAKTKGLPLRVVEIGDIEAVKQFKRAVHMVIEAFDGEVVTSS